MACPALPSHSRPRKGWETSAVGECRAQLCPASFLHATLINVSCTAQLCHFTKLAEQDIWAETRVSMTGTLPARRRWVSSHPHPPPPPPHILSERVLKPGAVGLQPCTLRQNSCLDVHARATRPCRDVHGTCTGPQFEHWTTHFRRIRAQVLRVCCRSTQGAFKHETCSSRVQDNTFCVQAAHPRAHETCLTCTALGQRV